jgi:hypothetical protein
MDLQVDLRRTLEGGRPETELEPEQGQEVSPVGVDAQPLRYPEEAPLSTCGRESASDFSEGLPVLPPDDDDLLNHDEADDNVPVTGNKRKGTEIDDEVGVAVVFDEEEQESDEEEAFEISESDEEDGGEGNKNAEAAAEGEEGEDA